MRCGGMVNVRLHLGSPMVGVLVALAVAVGGCRPGPVEGPPLDGTRWVLVALDGEPPLPGAAPSADFSAEQITGSTGCNQYFGEYVALGGDITIGDLARTERYCMDPEGVMDQEEAVLNALTSATSYRLTGAQLELLDADDHVVLEFEPAAAVPDR